MMTPINQFVLGSPIKEVVGMLESIIGYEQFEHRLFPKSQSSPGSTIPFPQQFTPSYTDELLKEGKSVMFVVQFLFISGNKVKFNSMKEGVVIWGRSSISENSMFLIVMKCVDENVGMLVSK